MLTAQSGRMTCAARPDGGEERGAGAEPAREPRGLPRPYGTGRWSLRRVLPGPRRAGAGCRRARYAGLEGLGRVFEDEQHDSRAEASDDVDPEHRAGVTGQGDHARGDERPDEVARAEDSAEGRERAGTVGIRDETGHEGVAGQREDGGREPDERDSDAEHERIGREHGERHSGHRKERAADHRHGAHRPLRPAIRSGCRR